MNIDGIRCGFDFNFFQRLYAITNSSFLIFERLGPVVFSVVAHFFSSFISLQLKLGAPCLMISFGVLHARVRSNICEDIQKVFSYLSSTDKAGFSIFISFSWTMTCRTRHNFFIDLVSLVDLCCWLKYAISSIWNDSLHEICPETQNFTRIHTSHTDLTF